MKVSLLSGFEQNHMVRLLCPLLPVRPLKTPFYLMISPTHSDQELPYPGTFPIKQELFMADTWEFYQIKLKITIIS